MNDEMYSVPDVGSSSKEADCYENADQNYVNRHDFKNAFSRNDVKS